MEGFERVNSNASSGNRRMQIRIANKKRILLSDDIAEALGPRVDLFVNHAEDFIQIAIMSGDEFTINANFVRKQRGFVNCTGFLRTLEQYALPTEWVSVKSVDGGIIATYDQKQGGMTAGKVTLPFVSREVQVDVERA